MANISDLTILEDGWRNAVFRYALALDGSGAPAITAMVLLTSFTNNDVNYTALTGFRIDRIQYAVDSDISARLYWGGPANLQLIAAVSQTEDLDFYTTGGLLPKQLNSGYDGSIMLETAGATPGVASGVTLLLQMAKLYTR